MVGLLPPCGRAHAVIIGGGFVGAAVALHLARAHSANALKITIVEPRAFVGGGVAYSSEEPAHRVNVPAIRMSLFPDDLCHFDRWLTASGELEIDPAATWTNGDRYPRRRVFGRYVEEQMRPFLISDRVRHVRGRAVEIERTGIGWTIATEHGETLTANFLVLAATHPAPSVPAALSGLDGDFRLVSDPYGHGALSGIDARADVLIVGSGLTSADMVAELDRRGHRGDILAISRHGLRSRGHPVIRNEPFGDFTSDPAGTAIDLLLRARATMLRALQSGLSWHAVIDRIRNDAPTIWATLPVHERSKLVRHLRTFWDVHRFRIAPQVGAILERRLAQGTYTNIAAALVASERNGSSIDVQLRLRGRSVIETRTFDVIINTTGPAHRKVLGNNQALRSLADAGLLRLDVYGLGLDTSDSSRAVSTNGTPIPTLLVAGPLARGAFGELMGLPEVANHAKAVAAEIGLMLGRDATACLSPSTPDEDGGRSA